MDPQQLVADAALLSAFVQMVVLVVPDSALPVEYAAFVVQQPDGALTLVKWPAAGLMNGARFKGSIPPGMVALVHTHPNNRLLPSTDDIAVAQRLNVPVLVLTRRGITVARPGSSTPEWVLNDPSWVFPKKRVPPRMVAAAGP